MKTNSILLDADLSKEPYFDLILQRSNWELSSWVFRNNNSFINWFPIYEPWVNRGNLKRRLFSWWEHLLSTRMLWRSDIWIETNTAHVTLSMECSDLSARKLTVILVVFVNNFSHFSTEIKIPDSILLVPFQTLFLALYVVSLGQWKLSKSDWKPLPQYQPKPVRAICMVL